MVKKLHHGGIELNLKDLFTESEEFRIEMWRRSMLEAKTPIGLYWNKWKIERLMKKVEKEFYEGLRDHMIHKKRNS